MDLQSLLQRTTIENLISSFKLKPSTSYLWMIMHKDCKGQCTVNPALSFLIEGQGSLEIMLIGTPCKYFLFKMLLFL